MIPQKKHSVLRLTPAERCTQGYERYLREDRALAKATIINYVPFIGDFLKDHRHAAARHAGDHRLPHRCARRAPRASSRKKQS